MIFRHDLYAQRTYFLFLVQNQIIQVELIFPCYQRLEIFLSVACCAYYIYLRKSGADDGRKVVFRSNIEGR